MANPYLILGGGGGGGDVNIRGKRWFWLWDACGDAHKQQDGFVTQSREAETMSFHVTLMGSSFGVWITRTVLEFEVSSKVHHPKKRQKAPGLLFGLYWGYIDVI